MRQGLLLTLCGVAMMKHFDRIVMMANDVDRLGGIGRFINEMAVGFHGRGYSSELVGVSPAPAEHRQVVSRPSEIVVRTLMPEAPPEDWQMRTRSERRDPARRRRHAKRSELRKIAVAELERLIPVWGGRTLIICTQVYGMEHLLEAGYDPQNRNHPRVIGQYHGSFDMAATTGRDLPRVLKSYPDADRTVFLSADDAERFRGAGLNNVDWSPNPVATPTSTEKARENVFISLGRYDDQKSLHYFLAAWEKVHAELPDWRCELYGEGPLRDYLTDFISDRRIPRAQLMGKTDQVGEALAGSKCHILSSQNEGLPISIVESGLLNVPTIAFDCAPGIHDLIDDGVTGFVVPMNNISLLADRMLKVASNANLLEKMGDDCAQAMKRYSPEVILDEWESRFEEMAR